MNKVLGETIGTKKNKIAKDGLSQLSNRNETLKVNEGMHKTPCKINIFGSCTVSI